MDTKRPKDLPFELPENITPDAYLLAGDPDMNTRTLLGRWYMPVGMSFIFGSASLLANVMRRRPLAATFPRHILYTVAGAVVGEWGYHRKEKVCAERDLQYLHYISLHPEDFEAPKRVLYRDYLTFWVPVR